MPFYSVIGFQEENPQTPKTLDQIHKEVKKEIQKRQIFLHQLKAQHKTKQEREKGAKGLV